MSSEDLVAGDDDGVIYEDDLKKLSRDQLRNLVASLRKLPDAPKDTTTALARSDPRDFIRDVLGERPTAAARSYGYVDAWTPDQDRVLVSVRDNRRTAVPAGHGLGKTHLAARLVIWHLFNRQPCKVITTAPTWRQVKKVLWPEIHTAFSKSRVRLPGKRTDVEIQLDRDWFAIGIATRPEVGDISATALQGLHSAHILIIFDEATGIPEEIWEAAEGIAVGPDDRFLAIGNPTDPASRFKRMCEAKRADGTPSWNVIHLDARNHPNVIHRDPRIVPGAATAEWVDDRLDEYGSEESPLFMAKVAGQWPMQSSDALISLGWIEKAQKKWERISEDKKVDAFKSENRGIAAALDVAGEGGDLTVLSFMREEGWEIPVVAGRHSWHVGRDLMQAVNLVANALREYSEIRVLILDDTGLGAGVSARLRQMQRDGELPTFDVRSRSIDPRRKGAVRRSLWIWPVNFGASAWQRDRFQDVKDELWWHGREALRDETIAMPSDEEIARWGLPKGSNPIVQLITPIYGPDSSGKIVVYDKRSSGLRGGSEALVERIRLLPSKSPDVAHSFIMACTAWKRLKPGQIFEPVSTTQEIFEQRTRALIDRKIQRGTPAKGHKFKGGGATPWQRRG